MDINEWAEWLKDTRARYRLSQQEFAEKVGISRTTLARIENKDPKLKSKTIAKISTALSNFADFSKHPKEKELENYSLNQPLKEKLNSFNKEKVIEGDLSYVFSNLVISDPNKAPETIAFLQSLNTAISGDNFIKSLANRFWDQIRLQMNQLAVGRATISTNPVIDLITVAIECAEKYIWATSMVSPATWWFTKEGQMYHQANIQRMRNAIEKGLDEQFEIKRIFVKNSANADTHITQIIKEQSEARIKVFTHDVDLPNWITEQDVLIIDDKFAVIIEINKLKQYEPALVSIFKADIENAKRLFNFIKNNSNEYI